MTRCVVFFCLVLFAALAALTACGRQDATSSSQPAASTEDSSSRGVRARRAGNAIELVVDGQAYRADTAGNLQQTRKVDFNPPRYDIEMTSGWIGNNTVSMVTVSLRDVEGRDGAVALGDSVPQAPALLLDQVPGKPGKRWRAISGSADWKLAGPDPETQFLTRVEGRFDGQFAEVDPGSGDLVDGGERMSASGSFDFRQVGHH